MSCVTINSLTSHWDLIIDEVVAFKEVDIDELQDLLKSACDFLEKYSKDELVPREISRVLLNMNDFTWWVTESEETPLHCLYRELLDIVIAINLSFIVTGFEDGNAKRLINELNKK